MKGTILFVGAAFLLVACNRAPETQAQTQAVPARTESIHVAAAANTSPAPPAANADIFGLAWGMTMDDVLKIHPDPAERAPHALYYKTSIDGNDAVVSVSFVENKLWEVTYVFHVEHANNLSYVNDFTSMDTLLTQKYGKPTEAKQQWADDLYRNDPSEWGMAVVTGRLTYRSQWVTARSNILHALVGDNFKASHGIIYSSIALAGEADKAKLKKSTSQL